MTAVHRPFLPVPEPVILCSLLVSLAVLPPHAVASWSAQVQFVEVSEQVGVAFKHQASPTSRKYLLETMGSGVAMFDFDGDGRLDIFFANGARIEDPMPPGQLPRKVGQEFWNRLFRQTPGRRFEDVTEAAGLTGKGYSTGVAVGDYNNDGFSDLYVTGFGENILYHNNGDGTFDDVTVATGTRALGWSTSAAFVDVDHDGFLDLLICRYLDWTFASNKFCGDSGRTYRSYCHPDEFGPVSSILLKNDGGRRFKDASIESGIGASKGKGLGVAIADFNRDGLIDLFVANDSAPQFLFQNIGEGKFEEVGIFSGTALDDDGNTYAGMGVDFSDYNNDTWPDLVVTVLSNENYPLYRNLGDGVQFSYASYSSGLAEMTFLFSGWGVRFLDFDHDGWKDLFVAQGHVDDTIHRLYPHISYRQPPLLLRNEGKQFVSVGAQAGVAFSQPLAARGMSMGDLDGDGDLDVVVTQNDGWAKVLRNDGGNSGNWLIVETVGSTSNRAGIGTAVKLTLESGMQQTGILTTCGSYQSASDGRVHFGLGRASRVKSLELHWPSGRRQQLVDLAPNQVIKVKEPINP